MIRALRTYTAVMEVRAAPVPKWPTHIRLVPHTVGRRAFAFTMPFVVSLPVRGPCAPVVNTFSAVSTKPAMQQAPPSPSPSGAAGQEYQQLQRLISWTLWTLVLQIVLTLLIQLTHGSQIVGAYLIESSTSVLLHVFNFFCIGVILRQNPFSHPYGTGKLENFAGFLYAVVSIPGAVWILYSAYSILERPPASANLGLATLQLLFSTIRGILLFRMANEIVRCHHHPSPMTSSYQVNMRVSALTNSILFFGVLLGFAISQTRYAAAAVYFDLAIASFKGVYLLHSAIKVLKSNFKCIVELPLPEGDQLKIMQALVAHFDAYEDIGNIYTQLSGRTRFVQIELYVKPTTTASELQALSNDLESRLGGQFSKLVFHLIPRVKTANAPGTPELGVGAA